MKSMYNSEQVFIETTRFEKTVRQFTVEIKHCECVKYLPYNNTLIHSIDLAKLGYDS